MCRISRGSFAHVCIVKKSRIQSAFATRALHHPLRAGIEISQKTHSPDLQKNAADRAHSASLFGLRVAIASEIGVLDVVKVRDSS
jgi:hypothetical protein